MSRSFLFLALLAIVLIAWIYSSIQNDSIVYPGMLTPTPESFAVAECEPHEGCSHYYIDKAGKRHDLWIID